MSLQRYWTIDERISFKENIIVDIIDNLGSSQ